MSAAPRRQLGFHVDRLWARGDLAAHIRTAAKFAANMRPDAQFAFQVFIAGPRTRKMLLDAESAMPVRAAISELGAWGVAHGTFQDVPWNGSPHACSFIREELEMALFVGLRGVVIHLGAPDAPAVMAILPRLMIDEALVGRCRAAGCRVYLEVPHVKPNKSHYETPEKLAALFKLVRTLDPDLKFFGLCIDTAHLWSCGANIASRAEAQDWFARLEAVHDVIPPAAIMFHLNDNRHSKGSGMDNHMELFGGAIWGEYTHDPASSGLAAVLDYARRFNIPTVLERKDPSKPKNPQDVLTRDYESLAQLDF